MLLHHPCSIFNQSVDISIIFSVAREPDLQEWTARTRVYDILHEPVRIAMVGKYTGLSDSYLSVLKALLHASVACRRKLVVEWVAAGDLEDVTAKEAPDVYKNAWDLLKGSDGVLVPGGFGDRGVQGKILAAKYARENKVPFLGVCLGMQIAVIEFARSVLGLHDANSTEFDPETSYPCVIFMPERVQKPTWGELCVWGQGELFSKFRIANLQSCTTMTVLLTSAIGIDMRSIQTWYNNLKMLVYHLLAEMKLVSAWRSLNYRAIHTLLALSSILNSSQGQENLRLFS
ncbi:hypothetical protein OIU77_013728 [Salix suchowensis]|uniref:CTP synthase (glutamine hydrolyzing) n=1 Tax=Salix suchowensis TaxID=1278906 RepID=A0ABQ8ZVM9_9ROSI|nr:hypothetical protein OIU77_013728 [Salix suchowensis]